MPTKEGGRHSKMAEWNTGKAPAKTSLFYYLRQHGELSCTLPKRLMKFIFDQALQVAFFSSITRSAVYSSK